MKSPAHAAPEKLWIIASSLVLLSIFIGLFDRAALFHDEIINTGKADGGVIFDYALRPVFYSVNYIAVSLFGNHPLSLRFITIVGFLVGGVYTYRYLNRDYGHAAATAGVAGYAWLGWAYPIGISAMPHMLPAVFVICALYLHHSGPPTLGDIRKKALTALLLWAALLTHPTASALLGGFVCMMAFSLTTRARKREISLRSMLQEVAIWGGLFVVLLLATELTFRYFAPQDGGYIAAWVGGLEKVSDIKYSRYFQPYGYYFYELAGRFSLILLLAVVSVSTLALTRIRSVPDAKASRSERFGLTSKLGDLFIFCVFSVGLISTEQWKFERVLVTFAPFVSLLLIAVIYGALPVIFRRPYAIAAGLTAVLTIWAGYVFSGQVQDTYKLSERRRPTYSSFFEQVRTLESRKIAYLGRKSAARLVRSPVSGSGRTLVHVAWPKTEGRQAEYLAAISEAGYRYLILDLREESGRVQEFRAELAKLGMQRRAVYFNGNYELWDLAPVFLGTGVEGVLDTLPRKSTVIVFEDLSDDWLGWTLADKGFRVSSLKNSHDARAIESAIKNGKAQAIAIGSSDHLRSQDVKSVLLKNGFNHVAEGRVIPTPRGAIEVWMRGHD